MIWSFPSLCFLLVASLAVGDQFEHGKEALDRKDYERAITHFDAHLRVRPNDAAGFYYRGIARGGRGEYDAAIADYSEAIRLDPRAEAFHSRADAYLKKGDYDKAIADCSEAIRRRPTDPLPFNSRGLAYAGKMQIAKALEDYAEAIRLDPRYLPSYHNRAQLHAQLDQFDRAISDYTEAVRLDPTSPRSYKGRALTYLLKGDFDGAIKDFTEVVRLDPKDATAFRFRGDAKRKAKDYASAALDYHEAVRLDPQFVAALDKLAWLLATCPRGGVRNGKLAVDLANRACEASRWKDAIRLGTLAAAYAECGDFKQAIIWARRAIDLGRGDREIRDQLKLYESGQPFRD